METFIAKVKIFFSTYKWLLFPIVPIIIFIYIIVYIFSAQKTPSTQLTQPLPTSEVSQSQEPSQASQQPQVSISQADQSEISPGELSPDQVIKSSIDEEANTISSGDLKLAQDDSDDQLGQNAYPGDDEVDEGSLNTVTLSDGSIEYEYPSDDPNRPHIQIIKGNAVIFRRNIMADTGITVTDYSDLLSNPEYTAQGSSYYGPTAMVYATPTKGIAIVANPQTGEVYEQYLFLAMSVSDYLQKYGKDISAFTPGP